MVNKTDQQLIQESVQGQNESFNTLVLRYQDRLYHSLFKILQNREDASDVVQEALMTAWKNLTGFRGDSGFYSWLFRIAYNAAMSRGRRKKLPTHSVENGNDSPVPLQDLHPDNTPSRRMELAEQQHAVQLALADLPEEYRTVLILKEMEDFKYEQIAEITQAPLGTVRSRIHRARILLRESLNQHLPDEKGVTHAGNS